MNTTLVTKTDWKSTLIGTEKGRASTLGVLDVKQYGAVRTAAWRLKDRQRMVFSVSRSRITGEVIAKRIA